MCGAKQRLLFRVPRKPIQQITRFSSLKVAYFFAPVIFAVLVSTKIKGFTVLYQELASKLIGVECFGLLFRSYSIFHIPKIVTKIFLYAVFV